MPLTLYQSSIPVFIRGLRNLAGLLEKGRANAKDRDFDPDILFEARLAPDMHNLCRQVQIACDMVKAGAGRLANVAPPSFPDNEATFEDLQQRVGNTIGFLATISPAQIDGAEDRTIEVKSPTRDLQFSGADYLNTFVLPNFYFHISAVFAILRHNGVPIGKRDFLGTQ
jgi:hypothetical protein